MEALYQKRILDYAKKSRSSVFLANPTHYASLDNPICGDRVDISLKYGEQHVEKIGVKVRGCALCEAGAGLALDCFTQKHEDIVRQLAIDFERWMVGGSDTIPLQSMADFVPVRTIRNRHKCVLLAFHATVKAFDLA